MHISVTTEHWKQQRQTYTAWSKKKKKSHTNILLDCVSFDDSTHPLFHYKLMQCYNTYFHLDLHFFTNILHWWWELDRYIKSSSANPGSWWDFTHWWPIHVWKCSLNHSLTVRAQRILALSNIIKISLCHKWMEKAGLSVYSGSQLTLFSEHRPPKNYNENCNHRLAW